MEILLSILNIVLILIISSPAIFIVWLYFHDKYQNQHSINRNYPIVGHIRSISEKMGPKLRQYFYLNDKEEKPVDRNTRETVSKLAKYGNAIQSFGSLSDFDKPRHYLVNSMMPKNTDELRVDNKEPITTYRYKILEETSFSRKEKRILDEELKPWYLNKEDEIVIGPDSENPFKLRGFIGISAMSFGALSKSAVKALAQGTIISGESWFNTGEGGISKYHLSKLYYINPKTYNNAKQLMSENKCKEIYNFIKNKKVVSNFGIEEHYGEKGIKKLEFLTNEGFLIERSANLIFQISSGLYGARVKGENEPVFSEEEFVKNASMPQVKAIELKLAQGAKTKGGHVEGAKVTPEIAEIRSVEPYKTIESPNRFKQFNDIDTLFDFIKRIKDLSKKPVGIKIVVGCPDSVDDIARAIKEKGFGPDFITVDGGEGGTGATFQEMADTVGLPIYSAILITDNALRKYGVRDKVKIIASGMLATPDKAAIAIAMGADLINVARAAMITIGCIGARECHTNHCPTGVTSHLPKLEQGLVVHEKRYRVANYLTGMRKSMYSLGAACGTGNPLDLKREHVVVSDNYNMTKKLDEIYPYTKNNK